MKKEKKKHLIRGSIQYDRKPIKKEWLMEKVLSKKFKQLLEVGWKLKNMIRQLLQSVGEIIVIFMLTIKFLPDFAFIHSHPSYTPQYPLNHPTIVRVQYEVGSVASQ